jgi:hypothetical protein
MVKFVVSEGGRLVSDGRRMMMWSRVAGNFWAMIFCSLGGLGGFLALGIGDVLLFF